MNENMTKIQRTVTTLRLFFSILIFIAYFKVTNTRLNVFEDFSWESK
jgi:hypothetical protein